MRRNLLKALLLVLPLMMVAQAHAGSVSLTLNRVTLINVPDAAGLYQQEGGTVFKGAVQVGNYVVTRRVTNGGTTAQNTAAVTITIFFLGVSPPENITFQGSHSFSTGRSIGSISAASVKYNWIRDGSYAASFGATTTLLVTWLGSSQLSLP